MHHLGALFGSGGKDLFKAVSKASKGAELAPRAPGALENIQARLTAFQEAGSEDELDGEVLFDRVLHEDSDEPLVDEHRKEILSLDIPVAPVDP